MCKCIRGTVECKLCGPELTRAPLVWPKLTGLEQSENPSSNDAVPAVTMASLLESLVASKLTNAQLAYILAERLKNV